MIRGIGIDIVKIDRLEHWLQSPGLIERFFHPDEYTFAFSRGPEKIAALAARFAAKEAFVKALGTAAGIIFKDIALVRNPGEAPHFVLYGSAATAVKRIGVESAHVSISHEKEYAVAIVILEN
jgi:holo-[acyl-carrier protein] synthase